MIGMPYIYREDVNDGVGSWELGAGSGQSLDRSRESHILQVATGNDVATYPGTQCSLLPYLTNHLSNQLSNTIAVNPSPVQFVAVRNMSGKPPESATHVATKSACV